MGAIMELRIIDTLCEISIKKMGKQKNATVFVLYCLYNLYSINTRKVTVY